MIILYPSLNTALRRSESFLKALVGLFLVNIFNFADILQQELIWAEVQTRGYDFETRKKLVPVWPGDMPITYVDTSAVEFSIKMSAFPAVDLISIWVCDIFTMIKCVSYVDALTVVYSIIEISIQKD